MTQSKARESQTPALGPTPELYSNCNNCSGCAGTTTRSSVRQCAIRTCQSVFVQTVLPPSTTTTCPVTKFQSETMDKATSATSSGVPTRLNNAAFWKFLRIVSARSTPSSQRVSINPGAMAFTLTSGARTRASDFVTEITPALEAQ